MSRGQMSERPWPYRLATLLGGLFLLTSLHHVYVHVPATEKIARLRTEIDAARLKLQQQAQERAGAPKLELELSQLKQETEMRIAEIAQVGDRPVLLAELSQIAQATGLEIVRLRPGKEKQREGYVELPVQLGLEGKFRDFLRFLGVLSTIPHLNSLGKLTVVARDTVQDPLSLDISLEILTYALPETVYEHRIRSAVPGFARVAASRVGKPSTEPTSLNSLRDPFHAPELPPCNKPLNGLESYDLNELRLVGIVWEPREPEGLVMDGASAGHIVIPGSPIGNRGGIVEAITPTQVVVRENSRAGAARSTSVKLPLFAFNKRPRNPETPAQIHREGTSTDGSTGPSPACRRIEAVRGNSH